MIDLISIYDYRNRVYSAALGRFLQTDPIQFEAGDGNLYRYVGNRLPDYSDPYGLQHFSAPLPGRHNGKSDLNVKSGGVVDIIRKTTLRLYHSSKRQDCKTCVLFCYYKSISGAHAVEIYDCTDNREMKCPHTLGDKIMEVSYPGSGARG